MNRYSYLVMLLLIGLQTGCVGMVTGGMAGNSHGHASEDRSQQQINRDAEITIEVNRAFVYDPKIPASDIRVSTYNGVVTLTGIVSDGSIRRRAVQTAREIPGVRSVQSYLNLR